MRTTQLFYLSFTGIIAVCLIAAAGCRDDRLKGLAPVDGTVVYKGEALVGAIVSFEPASGSGFAASCHTDAQGATPGESITECATVIGPA